MSTAVCDHSSSVAREPCARCGDFVCEHCRVWRSERACCGRCGVVISAAASKRARQALLLSTLGVLLLVPGTVAWILANAELKAVARGESSEASGSCARLARGMGMVETGLLVVCLIHVACNIV